MNVGLIGCGNMARAMARGWGRPLLCFDPLVERASALARETGGEALSSGAEVADRADLVVLCHKPAQLREVAHDVAPLAKAVASILAATSLASLKQAYPERPVYRFLPSLPAEVRRGAVVVAAEPGRATVDRAAEVPASDALATETPVSGRAPASSADEALDRRVRELFGELGTLVTLDDSLVDVAMGLMSCAPAYLALVVEAQVDAGVRRGIPAAQASALVTETLAGTAELLRRRDYDTLAVRREVASPGGTTARGLAALERGGVRAAFSDALDAVLGRAHDEAPADALAYVPIVGCDRRLCGRRGAPYDGSDCRLLRRGAMPMTVLLASTRTEVAGYLSTLIYVYTLLIVLYIVVQLLFSFGARPPYSRATDAVLTFLRDVCEPYLRIFRRVVPMVGAFDFSPIVAIIVLSLINTVVVNGLIHG